MPETGSRKARFMSKSYAERWTSDIAPKPDNYLHYYAKNADVAPNSLYQSIISARSRIASQAIASIGTAANASNFLTSKTQIDSTTMQIAEELLTNNWFPEAADMKLEGVESITTDEVNFEDLNTFTTDLRQVLQKILNVSQNPAYAKNYARRVFESFTGTSMWRKTPATPIAQQVIQQVLSNNSGQFFSIGQPVGTIDIANIVNQIALMVYALPSAYGPDAASGSGIDSMVTVGSKHMSLKQALQMKLTGWMRTLSRKTGDLANQLGAAKALDLSFTDIEKIDYTIKNKTDVVLQQDPSLAADRALTKAAVGTTRKWMTDTLSVVSSENQVEGRFQIYTPDVDNSKNVSLDTTVKDFNIVANESMLSVLMLHAGFTSGMIQDLIQILTYRDIDSAGYESQAANTWEAIKNIVPYLVIINRMVNIFQTSGGLVNTYFAFGGQVWTAQEIFNYIATTLGLGEDNSRAFLVVNDAGGLDRSVFVRINQFKRKYAREQDSEGNYVRGAMVPNTQLAIQRSMETLAQSQNQLMQAKVSVKLRLAELGQIAK